MRHFTVGLIIATAAMPVTATTFYAVSVEDLYKESDLMVSGIVESGATMPNDCGVAYTVRIDHPYKGTAASASVVTFQGYGPMQVGERYFLFMSKTEHEFRPIMSTNSGDMNMRARYVNKCKSVRPPYSVNIWGNGALKVTGTYNATLKNAVLFDSIVVTPPKQVAVTKLKVSDRYDNDRIDTAMDTEKFTKYMSKLSTGK